jgi:hypothetical protein
MGGGGGGGGAFVHRSPEELRKLVRSAEDRTTVAAFESELAGLLGQLLGGYNARDAETARERLDEIKDTLKEEMDGSFDQLFGGSVAKHTYVDGLSDVDSLILLDGSDLEDETPAAALQLMEAVISDRLEGQAEVSRGRMAVTVVYGDGMVIQVLPALRTDDGRLHVPSSRHEGWSRIDPIAFRDALTRRNDECAGKLVPTIKLAKAIIGQLPESQRLSGYHVESLAISAFKDYAGEKTTAAMLPNFFESAKDLVQAPIRDSTGQSIHVDEYLGPANSEARQAAGHVLGRLARRMRNASAAGSAAQWEALFGLEP